MPTRFATVEAYIDSFSEQVGERLRVIRKIASEVEPGAGERISYGIPAVMLDGWDVVFYSGWKRHVALYPVPGGDEELDRDLDDHRAGKGTRQFPHDRPLPEDLVRRVVAALANQRAGGTEAGKAPRS
ncbi:MAG: hypothetical protein JWO98_4652 [Frankiales bacterium]|nr:hypothetical protein [Frankiales bacterium]